MTATPLVITLLIMATVLAVLAALRAAQEKRKLPALSHALGQNVTVDMRQVKLSSRGPSACCAPCCANSTAWAAISRLRATSSSSSTI